MDLYFILFVLKQVLIKQDTQNNMNHISVTVHQVQAFVITNNVGMIINGFDKTCEFDKSCDIVSIQTIQIVSGE